MSYCIQIKLRVRQKHPFNKIPWTRESLQPHIYFRHNTDDKRVAVVVGKCIERKSRFRSGLSDADITTLLHVWQPL
jgi:hypothetical protein